MKYIQKISAQLDFLDHKIDINLKGRNLILTGKNGVGKTRFLNELNNVVLNKLIREIPQLAQDHHSLKIRVIDILSSELSNLAISLEYSSSFKELENLLGDSDRYNLDENKIFIEKATELKNIILKNKDLMNKIEFNYTHRHSPINQIEHLIHQIAVIQTNEKIDLVVNGIGKLSQNIQASKVTFNFFHAHRKSEIVASTNTIDLNPHINAAKLSYSSKLGQHLEQYLLNIRIEKALALSEQNDNKHANHIDQWFQKFDNDLKFLFEDDSTQLKFDYKLRKFSLEQSYREFTFQSLSSGFTAIFDIYSDLLMRSRLLNILPNELSGVVFIDELDAHLHISLQKKILPFLTRSFPEIQFIVSTHSPFVITSTDNDTVVYDISSDEFFEENLSQYSYESVIKGLFHVNPLSPETKESIELLKRLLNETPTNFEKLRYIVKDLVQLALNGLLDKNLKNLYLQAINLLADNNELEDLDV